MTTETRVLIVDDQADVRLVIRLTIEAAKVGLSVAGEAASGLEALACIDEVDPAVIVLDVMMPDMDGLETALRIRQRRPNQAIVLFTARDDDELREQAHAIGIDICLSKAQVRAIPAAAQQAVAEARAA